MRAHSKAAHFQNADRNLRLFMMNGLPTNRLEREAVPCADGAFCRARSVSISVAFHTVGNFWKISERLGNAHLAAGF